MSDTVHPKLFISYSWSSKEHEEWVLKLAEELRNPGGIDVILDKWDLKVGHDAYKFMEKMVTDPEVKKVLMICDKKYTEKVDKREGGAGTEAQIISPEIYSKTEQDKFVAVVKEYDQNGNPCVPVFYKSRIFIDLSSDELYAANFQQLVRWVYGKPLHIKNKLSDPPAFLDETENSGYTSSVKFKRAAEALRNTKDYAEGALTEYFEYIISIMEEFRIKPDPSKEFDDLVVESIDNFLPVKNEISEVFILISKYMKDSEKAAGILHAFFEKIIPYMFNITKLESYYNAVFDNYKFLIHELFLYCIAILLKYERFETAGSLLRNGFYIDTNISYSSESMLNFSVIRNYLESLDKRNKRLKLGRLSVPADLINLRTKTTGIDFNQIMQADFILYLRNCLDYLKQYTDRQKWYPDTLAFLSWSDGNTFELFARAQSKKYFDKIKILFDVYEKDSLDGVLTAIQKDNLWAPKWQGCSVNVTKLMGFDKLATRQ